MSIGLLRALLTAWLAVGIACAVWPLVNGWANWPAEAQAYARWVIYQVAQTRLPLAHYASLVGIGGLLVGALLLAVRVPVGRYIFLAGLLMHAYSKYTSLPSIASSAELGLLAVFYVLSGVVLGATFVITFARPEPERANPSIERTTTGKPVVAAHVERYPS